MRKRVDSASSIGTTDNEDESSSTTTSTYQLRKSRLNRLINWSHVISIYTPQLLVICIGVIVYQFMQVLRNGSSVGSGSVDSSSVLDLSLREIYSMCTRQVLDYTYSSTYSFVVTFSLFVVVLSVVIHTLYNPPCYLLAFSTFKAPDSWKVSKAQILECMKNQNEFTDESLAFMERMLDRSGTGNSTAWPPGILQSLDPSKKMDASIESSRKEAETVIFEIVEDALKKAKLSPKEIDFLVINCSLFSPTPSLCALVVNHFGMRKDVTTYNLSGMGCSASPISIQLARDLLKTRQNNGLLPFSGGATALVVSTEIITPNLYLGNQRSFLLQNTLFRCGGAAVVLSNKWSHGNRAWYKLLHSVRVQGTDESAYKCVYETQDDNNQRGVALSKDIVKVAGKCMEQNFVKLGPMILPLSEQAKVVWSLIVRKVMSKLDSSQKYKMYVPDFKKAVDHFCIHAGGRAVIDGIESNLELLPYHTEPSRMTLLNYGNTSSSSIWYELEYIQYVQKKGIKKGERVLQVAFGSGFKCTSCVWLKL